MTIVAKSAAFIFFSLILLGAATQSPTVFPMVVLALLTFIFILLVSWVANKITKKPTFNGAAVFFWLLLGLNVALHAYLLLKGTTTHGAYQAGQTTGYSIPLLVVAFFMARGFKKRYIVIERSRVDEDRNLGANSVRIPAP